MKVNLGFSPCYHQIWGRVFSYAETCWNQFSKSDLSGKLGQPRARRASAKQCKNCRKMEWFFWGTSIAIVDVPLKMVDDLGNNHWFKGFFFSNQTLWALYRCDPNPFNPGLFPLMCWPAIYISRHVCRSDIINASSGLQMTPEPSLSAAVKLCWIRSVRILGLRLAKKWEDWWATKKKTSLLAGCK